MESHPCAHLVKRPRLPSNRLRIRSHCSRRFMASTVIGFALWAAPPPVRAANVIWTAPNTTVTFGLLGSEVEFENPLLGSETVLGYNMLEWRDADYAAGPPRWYDDWSVSDSTQIDGHVNEIWMRRAGHRIWTASTVPSTVVSVHLNGDGNDGLADVFVDGVLVAQLDMGTAACCDRAVVLVTGLPNATHDIEVVDVGVGALGGDDIATFGAAALGGKVAYKWYQPPNPTQPDNMFYGWNELSVWKTDGQQVVADDWVCNTSDPVTDIHWWGSHLDWNRSSPPTDLPDRFHITIWDDVPAGADGSFSHPGTVVWEIVRPYSEILITFVGWDYDPRMNRFDGAFRYDLDLFEEEWFLQDPAGTSNVYWISIAGEYDTLGPLYPWGWKTRPHDPAAPDDAVVIEDPTDPINGSVYQAGHPITWPGENDSWDMAFELTTNAASESIRWEQLPELGDFQPPYDGCFFGFDEWSVWDSPQIVANDWVCRDERPVSDVHWWGSYQNWTENLAPGPGPDFPIGFYIQVWSDVPASVDGFSHPGATIHNEWYVDRTDANETYVGCDYYPGGPQPEDDIFESAFRYDFRIPDVDWFYQDPTGEPTIYWISIAAVYENVPCACNADFDHNGIVDPADNVFFQTCFANFPVNPTGACRWADLTCDDRIDFNDAAVMVCQWQRGWPDPACCIQTPQAQYVWGWKTRPFDGQAPDMAVRMWLPYFGGWSEGEPIETPDGIWWDTAFMLTSVSYGEPTIKWSQPPEPYSPSDAYWGWNELSVDGESGIGFARTVADDWRCTTDEPVSDVHWWGSFIGWGEPVPPPNAPGAFRLAIWQDVPGGPPPLLYYSHPGRTDWVYECRDFTWEFVGWDINPKAPNNPPETCFKFECVLPEAEWFLQDLGDNLYWISIGAMYDSPTGIQNPFGVKTRLRDPDSLAPDSAVVITTPTTPVVGGGFQSGFTLRYPTAGIFWDLAFALTTSICEPPEAPLPEPYALPVPGTYVAKNRYLAFIPPPVPPGATSIALRVTLTQMPGPNDCPKIDDYSAYQGQTMWVGSEIDGTSHPGVPGPCGVCGLAVAALYQDWRSLAHEYCVGATGSVAMESHRCVASPSGIMEITPAKCVAEGGACEPLMIVSDCNIVPCAQYTIEAVSDACPNDFSAPLTLPTTQPGAACPGTSPRWGDIVGAYDVSAHRYQPADGCVDFIDIQAIVERFSNLSKAPARGTCDLFGEPTAPISNETMWQGAMYNVDFRDIASIVSAYGGGAYPLGGPTAPNPCP